MILFKWETVVAKSGVLDKNAIIKIILDKSHYKTKIGLLEQAY
jgi:hypothetical protein